MNIIIITFADWAAEVWVSDRVGTLDRRTLFLTANNISSLQQTQCMKKNQSLKTAIGACLVKAFEG